MDFLQSKRDFSVLAVVRGTVHVLLLLVTILVQTLPVHTSSSPTSQRPSHMRFQMTTELQILPKTQFMENLSYELLKTQCNNNENQWRESQCFNHAKKLKPIPGLEQFPSQSTLLKEGSKPFPKHLFKDAHRTLQHLEKMLGREEKDNLQINGLVQEISSVRELVAEQLESFFGVTINGSMGNLRKAKRRYLQENMDLTEKDYLLRLFYTAFERFKQMGFVLKYAMRLSEGKQFELTQS